MVVGCWHSQRSDRFKPMMLSTIITHKYLNPNLDRSNWIHVPCIDGYINTRIHVQHISCNPFNRWDRAKAFNPKNETRLYKLFSQVSSQIHVAHFNRGVLSDSNLVTLPTSDFKCASWVKPNPLDCHLTQKHHRNTMFVVQIYGFLLKVGTQILACRSGQIKMRRQRRGATQ